MHADCHSSIYAVLFPPGRERSLVETVYGNVVALLVPSILYLVLVAFFVATVIDAWRSVNRKRNMTLEVRRCAAQGGDAAGQVRKSRCVFAKQALG